MERIGIAASKISKGNLFLYNLNVVLISFLFSLFIFVIAGSTVLFALMIIGYVAGEIKGADFDKKWFSIFSICMVTLTILIGLFNLFAISRNLKFKKGKGL